MPFKVYEEKILKIQDKQAFVVTDTIVASVACGYVPNVEIGQLTDVDLTDVQDGQILVYSIDKWINADLNAGSHGDLSNLSADDHEQYLLHDRTGDAQGDILYYNGTTWVSLVAGTSGYYLKTQGSGSDPIWDVISTDKNITWVIESPATGGIPGPKIMNASTIKSLNTFVKSATSATFNIKIRDTIGVAGTNILASDIVADVDGESTTTFAEEIIDANDYLWVDISAVDGTPEYLTITMIIEED